jgi:hypothetical protein
VPRESYLIATKAFGPMGKGPNDAGASRGHLLNAASNGVGGRRLIQTDTGQLVVSSPRNSNGSSHYLPACPSTDSNRDQFL